MLCATVEVDTCVQYVPYCVTNEHKSRLLVCETPILWAYNVAVETKPLTLKEVGLHRANPQRLLFLVVRAEKS